MSELNHELDRDNLNKEHVEPAKVLGGLSFPSEGEHYERYPNQPVKTGRVLAMSFEKIS